jgi:hypothetical protein
MKRNYKIGISYNLGFFSNFRGEVYKIFNDS